MLSTLYDSYGYLRYIDIQICTDSSILVENIEQIIYSYYSNIVLTVIKFV